MSSARIRYLLLGALVIVMVPVGASALAAATHAKAKRPANAATLTLAVKASKALKRQHVTLRALRPATRRKSSYALPDTSGKWNFANATGTLHFRGVLAIVYKKHSVKIRSVTFTRPKKGNGRLTVKLAGHKVKLFTITGRARVKRSATSETIRGLTAKLTKPGATKLDKALHRRAFKAGQKFGSFTVTVGTSPITTSGTASGTPGVTGASTTGAGLQFAPAFRSALDSLGLSTLPLIPASNGLPGPLGTTTIPGLDGTSVTLPLGGGSAATAGFANGTLTGTIPLSGGLQLDNGQISVGLTNPQLTLGTGTEGSSLSFELNGLRVKLFDIDTSQLAQAALPNGTLDLKGLLATLSSEGAATLNQLLGTNAFTTAEPVGGLTLIVPQPPQ